MEAKVIHCRDPWRSFEIVEYAALEWVDRFYNLRLLEPIGNIPAYEAEANFYAALEMKSAAAKLISLRHARAVQINGVIDLRDRCTHQRPPSSTLVGSACSGPTSAQRGTMASLAGA